MAEYLSDASREDSRPAQAIGLFERRLIFNTNKERNWRLNALSPQDGILEVKVVGGY